jgi:hypothetical protein
MMKGLCRNEAFMTSFFQFKVTAFSSLTFESRREAIRGHLTLKANFLHQHSGSEALKEETPRVFNLFIGVFFGTSS